MFDSRIPCTYKGEKHWFHTWFQEGAIEPNNGYMEGSIDLGAVLETESGKVVKVWDITEIKFEREAV